MKFCNFCGGDLTHHIPDGDNRHRHQCGDCDVIHYQNPKLVVGTLVTDDQQRVLLCRRAIEPRYGFWTLPAGYMENGETTLEGALRETYEEAEVKVADPHLYQIYNVPNINQVYMIYRAKLSSSVGCGIESLECRLFSADDIPWEQLAFSTVKKSLKRWFGVNSDLSVREDLISSPTKKASP